MSLYQQNLVFFQANESTPGCSLLEAEVHALRKQRLPKSMAELAPEIGSERWTLSPGRVGVESGKRVRTYVFKKFYIYNIPPKD